MFKLFQKSNEDLFSHLAAIGQNVEAIAARFEAMVSDWAQRETIYQGVRELELEGDRRLREAHEYLRDTFFVPGDREAMYAITNELDDICDDTLKIASYLLLYHVAEPSETFIKLVAILHDCCSHLKFALEALGNRSERAKVQEHCLQVITLEDEAGKVYRLGLQALFDRPDDLAALLKWKDILDWTDRTVNHANHVAYRIMGALGALA